MEGRGHTLSSTSLLTWEELHKKQYNSAPYILDPYIPTGGITFCFAPPSCGKCLGPDVGVLMFDGTVKKAKDIVIGDRLMGPDSTPRNVLATHTGEDNMYRVSARGMDSWECAAQHTLVLKVPLNGRKLGMKEVREMSMVDYLIGSKTLKRSAAPVQASIEFGEKELPIEPYLLGALLGDGCLKNKCMITNMDQEILDKVKSQVERMGLVFARRAGQYNYSITKGETNYVVGKRSQNKDATVPNILIWKLEQLGLRVNSEDKFVPHLYKTASRFQRLELLAGLIDTDGGLEQKEYFVLSSKSETLALDVAYLARSLGFQASVRETQKSCQTGAVGTYFIVQISGDGLEEIPVQCPRKWPEGKRLVRDNVIKVEYIGVGQYYGFEVDGDHRHLLADFTVTHNSALMWRIAHCVGYGEDFFGLPVAKGRVLIIELDTPEMLVAPRVSAPKIEKPAPNVWFFFAPHLNIPEVRPEIQAALMKARDIAKPDLVILNTLRKAHAFDDRESNVPSIVYAYLQNLFGKDRAILIMHHTKKAPPGNVEVEAKEQFSGSNAWLADAQSGLFLQRWRHKNKNGLYSNVRLCHAKSQVSALYRPLPLLLSEDGTNWDCPLYNEMKVVESIIATNLTMGVSGLSLDKEISEALKEMGAAYSTSTARRRRIMIENGTFPGTREWLGRESKSEEEEEE